MTVKELIKALKDEDPDMPVYFAHPSHDYWRNTLASEVDELEPGTVQHSEYHGQMKVVEEPEDGEELVEVLILR